MSLQLIADVMTEQPSIRNISRVSCKNVCIRWKDSCKQFIRIYYEVRVHNYGKSKRSRYMCTWTPWWHFLILTAVWICRVCLIMEQKYWKFKDHMDPNINTELLHILTRVKNSNHSMVCLNFWSFMEWTYSVQTNHNLVLRYSIFW